MVVDRNSKQRSVLCDTVLERHSVSSYQHMKNLMSLFECLHVMMQCYMRQHFADRYRLREHPGGHASWKEYTRMRNFTKECSQKQRIHQEVPVEILNHHAVLNQFVIRHDLMIALPNFPSRALRRAKFSNKSFDSFLLRSPASSPRYQSNTSPMQRLLRPSISWNVSHAEICTSSST